MSKVQSKLLPSMQGKFVKWISDTEFIASLNGTEILAHRDYWVGDILRKNHKA